MEFQADNGICVWAGRERWGKSKVVFPATLLFLESHGSMGLGWKC